MSDVIGSRVILEIVELRNSLDKSVKASDSSEIIMDKLIAIDSIPINAELIKESKVGKVLLSTRTKYNSESLITGAAEVSEKARNIMVKWKSILEEYAKKEKIEKDKVIADNDHLSNQTTEKSTGKQKDNKQTTEKKFDKSFEKAVADKATEKRAENILKIKKISAVDSGSVDEKIKNEMARYPEGRRKVGIFIIYFPPVIIFD